MSNKAQESRAMNIHSGMLELIGEGAPLEILNAIRSPILYFSVSGVVTYANEYAHRRFQCDDLQGNTFLDFAVFWDDPSLRQSELFQVIARGTAIWHSLERSIEFGRDNWFRVDKVPTLNAEQEVTGVVVIINDVSEHIYRERALEESQARYKSFVNNSVDAIWRYDICPPIDTSLPIKEQAELLHQRAILAEGNQPLAELFDVDDIKDVIGLPLHQNESFTNKSDAVRFIKNEYRLDACDYARIDTNGDTQSIQNSAIGIIENGMLIRAWGTSRDVSMQKRYVDHMEFAATHDELTKLPNRTLLYRKIEESLEKGDQQVALLLFDLDKFKDINDTLGHATGDNVLKEVGPRLMLEAEGVEIFVSRLGGDEFAVLMPNIRNAHQAVTMAHRLIDAISAPFDLGGVFTEISASVGIAIGPGHAPDVSTLMRHADVAMYHAKNQLKGVSVYDSGFDTYSPQRLEMTVALRRAIRNGDLEVHYQPKMDVKTNKIYGYEALVRWHHPELGTIPPCEFVPIAEASRMIFPMTVWVMRQAVEQCAKWLAVGHDVSIAINLSPRNLSDERIVHELSDALSEFNVDGSRIELEITENMLMSDSSRAQHLLTQIGQLGVAVSVDDYGTGYSSLAYLKRLPISAIKIDKSFVCSMQYQEQDNIIVHSTIQLAHNLGLKVVAEGVENQETLTMLHEHGCDYVQGYFISKPMPSQDATDWLQKKLEDAGTD